MVPLSAGLSFKKGIMKAWRGLNYIFRQKPLKCGDGKKDVGLVLHFLYAYLNSQHVSSEIIKPKQQVCVVCIGGHLPSYFPFCLLDDSILIELLFIAGWLLISVFGSVVYH